MVLVDLLLSAEVGVGVATFLLVYWIVRWIRQPQNLPPGPLGLPIIGASYLLSNDFHKEFVELAKKYGDVFSLYMANRLTVVINNAHLIRENFGTGDHIADRTMEDGVGEIVPYRDVIFHCPYTKGHNREKKFAKQALRTFITGRIDEIARVETEVMLKHIQANLGKPIRTMMMTRQTATNIIFTVSCSTRYEEGDPEQEKIIEFTKGLSKGLSDSILLTAWFPVPLIRLFYPKEVRNSVESCNKMVDLIKEKIKQHQQTFDPNNLRDMIDFYLNDGKYEQYGEQVLADTISILQIDAMSTLVDSLNFVIMYPIAYPEVQKRIQKEIDEVIGWNRFPTMADRSKMPFTEATIWEVLRVTNPFPTTLYHTALRDTTIAGYHVPKYTQVIANLYAAHSDPEIFPEPEKFMPERFVKDGKFVPPMYVMPFSLGRRKCVGEALSLSELFLIPTAIYQRFRLTFAGSDKEPESLKAQLTSAMATPASLEIVAHER